MSGADAFYLAIIGLVGVLGAGGLRWAIWDSKRRFGPVTPGSPAWKFQAAAREAARVRLNLLDHLTNEDRDWLIENGWDPHGAHWCEYQP